MSAVRWVWSAVGTARDAAMSIADQAKLARQQYPSAGATIVAARDEVCAMIRASGQDDVSVSCEVTLSVQPVETPAVADVVADEEDEDTSASRWRWR